MADHNDVHPAYFAGQWYPDDAEECRAALADYLDAPALPGNFRGLVGPHAGWSYSGKAAGHGYRQLQAHAAAVELVVIFGGHRSALGPNSVFCGRAWQTPLGELPCAQGLARELQARLGLDLEPVRPRQPDNAVELHLPFIRYVFPKAKLLMLGVAAAPVALEIGRQVGEACRQRGHEAVFVGSTDLTHYGSNYGITHRGHGDEAVAWVRNSNDRGFIDRLLARDAAGALAHATENHSACCPGAAAATLAALEGYGHTLAPQLADHYLSYDVRPAESFVGYASLVF
jgi:MEMO1 family protein